MSEPDRLSGDGDGTVYACPDCDQAGCVYRRHGDNTYAGDPDDPYACGNCGATFDEPVERESKGQGNTAKYADLSPDDLGMTVDDGS